MSEQQKEELERILKEIYSKYQGFSMVSLYYKIGRNIHDISNMNLDMYPRIIEIALDPRLEYAVFVVYAGINSPSRYCIEGKQYFYVLPQFITPVFSPPLVFQHVRYAVSERDPLGQVLRYGQLMTGYGPQHTYLCPDVEIIEPYRPDLASIFPGKKGVVAYCITLADFVRLGSSTIEKVGGQLSDLVFRALGKLESSEELKNLRQRAPPLACNVSFIEKLVHNEIEEANKLMKQYNIIRVAFPLD